MSDITISQILAFLTTRQNRILSKIQTSKHEGRLPFVAITFCYSGYDIMIQVYNDTFIKLIVDNSPYSICDSVVSLRDSLYKLDHDYNRSNDIY